MHIRLYFVSFSLYLYIFSPGERRIKQLRIQTKEQRPYLTFINFGLYCERRRNFIVNRSTPFLHSQDSRKTFFMIVGLGISTVNSYKLRWVAKVGLVVVSCKIHHCAESGFIGNWKLIPSDCVFTGVLEALILRRGPCPAVVGRVASFRDRSCKSK